MSRRQAPPPRPLAKQRTWSTDMLLEDLPPQPAPPPRPLAKQRTWSPDMLLEDLPPQPAPPPLYKQRSWSPDMEREEAWHRRSLEIRRHNRDCPALRRSKSVTNEDLQDLKGCIDLGFGFSPEIDPKLADTLPALELYYAVNKQYSLSRSSSASSLTDSETGSSGNIIDTGDDPETVKTRLKQWAQVVACSVRQSSPSPTILNQNRVTD